MNEDLQCWYKALELEPGASLEEVNQAYKDLVLVWHPDRLPQDSPRLQEKAQAKLKEINNARDRLREYQATRFNANDSISNSSTGNNPSQSSTRSTSRTTGRESASHARQQPRRATSRPETYAQRVRQPTPSEPSKAPDPVRVPQAAVAKPTNHRHHIKTPQRTPPKRPDLSGVDWSGTNLNERDLSGRNLANANLSNTELQDSFLHGANLQGANLQKANLFRANLFQANLSNANLREANLIGADLSGADLSGADLTGARIRVGAKMMVRFVGANLTGAIMPDGQVFG